jgi:anti-sigma-K factor RskA
MTCEQVTAQLDSYVLGGLDRNKEAEIARHIFTCRRCQRALENAHKTADLLALVTPSHGPASAWKWRIRNAMRPIPNTTRQRASLQPARLPGTLDLSPGAVFAVMIALVTIGAMWAVIQFRDRPSGDGKTDTLKAQSQDRDTLVSLVNDRSVTEHTIRAASDEIAAIAHFYANPQSHQGGLVVMNLPALPAKQTYQVWLIDANGAFTSAGMLHIGEDSAGSVVVRSRLPLGSYRSLDVTIEPAGGSRRPSGPRVLTGSF